LTAWAVQFQRLWVDTEERGRDYAQRGMRDLCRLLLAHVPHVCQFVRPENGPAIRVYEAIGMRHALSYRSVIF
jgi:predicted GNAT family acetyltransferase